MFEYWLKKFLIAVVFWLIIVVAACSAMPQEWFAYGWRQEVPALIMVLCSVITVCMMYLIKEIKKCVSTSTPKK